jgi:toxin FitB
MMGWLLDTNFVSAFGPGKRPISPQPAAWFRARTDALHMSTISAAEVEGGIAKLRRTGSGRRADNLRRWFDRILDDYADRFLSFGLAAARIAGALRDAADAEGRQPGCADVAIAATAKSREPVILTVNLRHFEPVGVNALNPFELDCAMASTRPLAGLWPPMWQTRDEDFCGTKRGSVRVARGRGHA